MSKGYEGYGTFSEQSPNKISKESYSKLENGDKCFEKPTKGISPLPTTALIAENFGSIARDNLSIERSFLSWLRLSTTLIVVGTAYFLHYEIVELPSYNHSGLLGLILVFLGNLALFWSLWSYLQFQRMIDKRAVAVENGTFHFVIAGLIGITGLAGFILQR